MDLKRLDGVSLSSRRKDIKDMLRPLEAAKPHDRKPTDKSMFVRSANESKPAPGFANSATCSLPPGVK